MHSYRSSAGHTTTGGVRSVTVTIPLQDAKPPRPSLQFTVTSVAPLHAPFRAPYTVARGLPVNPGEDLRIPVTFTPTRSGTFTSVYRLTWTDRFGAHTLDVSLTGAGAR